MLDTPPAEVVAERTRLTARAKDKAAACVAKIPPTFDCVVPGSGFFSLYYLGVQSVLTQLEAAGRTKVQRYAGASSGSQAAFQVLLQGLDNTMDAYLAHALLIERHAKGAGMARWAWLADVHWKAMGERMIANHEHELTKLDGRMYTSVTHWMKDWRLAKNAIYTQYSHSAKFAREAFYATGTAFTRCNGYWSSDGDAAHEPLVLSCFKCCAHVSNPRPRMQVE